MMNFPNKLTSLRMVLIPVLVAFFLTDNHQPFLFDFSLHEIIFLGIFIFASLTDFFDGWYARKYGMVTTYGKFMDPIADKLLVNISLILLTVSQLIHPLFFIIMFSRDMIVDGVRMLAASKGVIVAANMVGKFKTVLQLLAIIAVCLHLYTIGFWIFILGTIVSVWSGSLYVYEARKLIFESI